MKQNNHGGKRPNSGRPPSEKKKEKYCVSTYPENIERVREYAKKLDNEQKEG